ncbi:MAG: heparinase II/III family protein, partial [Firmicutes bacterium]|nr:heparinase II/III family protein [Candidatus Colimorpha enterica]
AEEQAEIDAMKAKNAAFSTEDFGKKKNLEALDVKGFDPKAAPRAGHPRVMFTADDYSSLMHNLKAKGNDTAYKRYFSESSKKDTESAVFDPNSKENLSFPALMEIQAMAYRYYLTDEEIYAQRAIYALKNTLLELNLSSAPYDLYRGYGDVAYVAACVYDWCYDVLSDLDKEQIVLGTVNKCLMKMEIGVPPSKAGDICHHNTECQLNRTYLSFALAVYDEYPFIYNFAVGRLSNRMAEAQDYLLQSGLHWEGDDYVGLRLTALLQGQYLYKKGTGADLYNDADLHRTALSVADTLLPGKDNLAACKNFEIGDQCGTENMWLPLAAFFGASIYNEPGLYTVADSFINAKTNFAQAFNNYVCFSPVDFLILNDPELEHKPLGESKNLVNIIDFPKSSLFARTSWEDDGAIALYMTMNEVYTSSHSHMEAGSFQIYWKGWLISDSGVYDSYGSDHHYAYSMQTISANSVLVYNPAMRVTDKPTRLYSGGQSIRIQSRLVCPTTLDQLKKSGNYQAEIFGKTASVTDGKYEYSYLAGDMTKAYDKETVSEATRHLISVMTGNEQYPMVFVTFDRVTAVDASFKKTFLLHAHYEPKIDGEYITIDNTKAKLVAQNCFTDMNYTVWGANGTSPYNVGVQNVLPTKNGTNPDFRVDMCPKEQKATDLVATVMYVTDSSNTAAPVKAETFENGELMGTKLLGVVTAFAKSENALASSSSFTVDGDSKVFVGGVKAGSWKVTTSAGTSTVTVGDSDGLLSFTSPAGEVKIEYVG